MQIVAMETENQKFYEVIYSNGVWKTVREVQSFLWVPVPVQGEEWYRHFKKGELYVVWDKCVDVEKERMVLYQNKKGKVFLRPYSMFTGIDEKSGKKRFVVI